MYKGYIVQERMAFGTADWFRGGGSIGTRIIVPELDNLAITIFQGKIAAFQGYEKGEDTVILNGRIFVPADIVQAALEFARANQKLIGLMESVKSLAEPYV